MPGSENGIFMLGHIISTPYRLSCTLHAPVSLFYSDAISEGLCFVATVVKNQRPWYTDHEVRCVRFQPFVFDRQDCHIPVIIEPMTQQDAELTNGQPLWQTSWTSEFLLDERFQRYAARAGDELIALGAYEILENALVVHIVYLEAQPESNPTLDEGQPKYTGIGRLMIAYGIKLSIDNGLAGDVVLEAKTTALAKHYERDFGAVRLPTFQSSAPRYLIADEAAKRIFFTYLV